MVSCIQTCIWYVFNILFAEVDVQNGLTQAYDTATPTVTTSHSPPPTPYSAMTSTTECDTSEAPTMVPTPIRIGSSSLSPPPTLFLTPPDTNSMQEISGCDRHKEEMVHSEEVTYPAITIAPTSKTSEPIQIPVVSPPRPIPASPIRKSPCDTDSDAPLSPPLKFSYPPSPIEITCTYEDSEDQTEAKTEQELAEIFTPAPHMACLTVPSFHFHSDGDSSACSSPGALSPSPDRSPVLDRKGKTL